MSTINEASSSVQRCLPANDFGAAADGKASLHKTSVNALKAGLGIKQNFSVVYITVYDATGAKHDSGIAIGVGSPIDCSTRSAQPQFAFDEY